MAVKDQLNSSSRVRLESIRVPKTGEVVARSIRRRIISGEIGEGDSLPPEAQLIEELNVSRAALREGLRVLEAESLISIRRGSRGGAQVHAPSGDVASRYVGLMLEYQDTKLSDVYEARMLIEPICVGLLASRRTTSDLAALRACLERDVAAPDAESRAQAQTEFHNLIVTLSGNNTLRILCNLLYEIVDRAARARANTKTRGLQIDEAVHLAERGHQRVLKLIKDRDSAGAEAFWRRHLSDIATYLLEATDAETVLDLMEN
jgi:GntR family transcriptional regulator, transcriptional repressor for pyruvate dehydrogenase complex